MIAYIKLLTIIAITTAPYVNSQTFLPSQTLSQGAATPEGAVGLAGRNSFKKVLEKDNITKWTQTIDNIPVYGSVLTTEPDNEGKIKTFQGFVSKTADLVDTRPTISGATALNTLKMEWNHSDKADQLMFRDYSAQLMILQTDNGFDKLVWKVGYFVHKKDFISGNPDLGTLPAYPEGLINAKTGVVEETWNQIQFAKIWGIFGNDKTRKAYHIMDVERKGRDDCWHRDAKRRVEVFDNRQRRGSTSSATSKFRCNVAANDNWDLYTTTRGYSPRNEAFRYAIHFVDMWKEMIGDQVQPYRTSTSYLRFYTHYDRRFENAFFDGDSFKFGDGDRVFYPLTSLDIVCHEIGHAITSWHGGRMEYRKQSGAMNEAYSDILGETCDIHYKKKTNGLIGEDIMRPGNWLGDAMRNMCNPPKIANALDHMNKYRDNIDVHYTSGIYNKAWCTLKNTNGWNYIRAFQVFTDANLLYWNARSTMHCGACGVETAAKNRRFSVADVRAAFNAVGVSCRRCRR